MMATTTARVSPLNEAAVTAFVRHLRARGRSRATAAGYRADLLGLLGWHSSDPDERSIPFDELDGVAAEWLNDHRHAWSAATMQRRRAAVRSWAAWATDRPVSRVDILATYKAPTPPRGTPHPIPGLLDTVGAMLEVTDTAQQRFFIALCGYMGLRANEALEMAADDFDGRRALVHGKGSKERWVPIPSQAVGMIEEFIIESLDAGRAADAALMTVSYRTTLRWVSRLAREVGVTTDVATHCLRMTAATHLYESTGDVRHVQELLGHADMRTTARYIGVEWAAIAEGMEL